MNLAKIEEFSSKHKIERGWVLLYERGFKHRVPVAIQGEIERAKIKEGECPHKKTVAINEEGHAGVYCADCGEQLEKEC